MKLFLRSIAAFTLVLSALSPAASVDVEGDVRSTGLLFETVYERPFAHGYTDEWRYRRFRWAGHSIVRIWDTPHGREGSLFETHLPAVLRDCGRRGLYVCVEGAGLSFAVPLPYVNKWSATVGPIDFRLMSRQRVRFRGKNIDVVTIKGIDRRFNGGALYFAFNYEVGLISYATVEDRTLSRADEVIPDVLTQTAMLVGEHGAGGREFCKYWTCGPGL